MIALVSGGFDPVHCGHLDMLIAAKHYGTIIVVLNSDEWLVRKKGYVFMPWGDRARILQSLEFVDSIAPVDDSDDTICDALRRIRPDYFLNGGDRIGDNINYKEHRICMDLGIKEVFNVGGAKVRSSSELVRAAKP